MPKIGLRNIKTAISVFICILIFDIFKRPYPFYACIAAVICMKDSVENSLVIGKNRMIGTIIGGILGYVFSAYVGYNAFVCALGISLLIYLCNFLKQNSSIVIACVVFIAIMTNLKGTPPHIYALGRVEDTFIGIIVSILVNKFLNFKKENDCSSDI